jgi:hypothetical protein
MAAIEYTLLKYLNDNLNGIQAYMEEPRRPANEYVIIEKTGSSVENLINSATFAIQSYSTSMQGAIDLNEDVKAVMDHFWEHSAVYSCRLNSDYNFTDTDTQRYRYQAVYDLTF